MKKMYTVAIHGNHEIRRAVAVLKTQGDISAQQNKYLRREEWRRSLKSELRGVG